MAKSDIGTLTIYMDAVTDRFHAGLGKAEKSMTTFRGKIKGFNRTFTEMRNKVLLVSTAVEAGVKAFRALGAILEGDFQGARKLFESMPLVGGAIKAIGETIRSWTGITDELEAIEARIKATKEYMAEMDRLAKEFKSSMDDIAKATIPVLDSSMVLRVEYDRIAAALADPSLSAEQLAVEVEKAAEAAQRLSREITEEDTLRAIESRLDAQRELTAELKETMRTMTTNTDEYALLDKQLFDSKRITESLEKQLTETHKLHMVQSMVRTQADELAKRQEAAAKATKDQVERTKELEKAQSKLAGMSKSRATVSSRGLSGGSNTFRSPMGTISLPSLNDTAQLAQKQLTELQSIDRSILEVQTSIAELSRP